MFFFGFVLNFGNPIQLLNKWSNSIFYEKTANRAFYLLLIEI